MRVFSDDAINDEADVCRLARVVESFCKIHFRAARAKDQHVCRPCSLASFAHQCLRVLRPDCSFKPVKDEKTGLVRSTGKSMNIEKIAVRCSPTLASR